jgi:hypothetical protein
LNRLTEPELAEVEEHLLICPTCQDRLQEVDDFVRAFRLAAAKRGAGSKDTLRPEAAEPWYAPGRAWLPTVAIWAGGLAALLLIVVRPVPRDSLEDQPAQTIALSSERGVPRAATAKAGRISLRVDLRDPADRPLRVEISRPDDGSVIWSDAFPAGQTSSTISPERAFPAGAYWVRLRGQDDGRLEKEFGLTLTTNP